MVDQERKLRSSDERMVGYTQEATGSQPGYGSRLTSLVLEFASMNESDQEFLRALLISGSAQNHRSPLLEISPSVNTSHVSVPAHSHSEANSRSQMPPQVHYTTLVPPRFAMFSGEGQ